jgi:hypothetical protein
MDLKSSFSYDSVLQIQSLGKEWANLRRYDPPYPKRDKTSYRERGRHGPRAELEEPPAQEPNRDHPEAKDGAEGFEITV